MKRLFLISFTLILMISAYAQSASGRYFSRKTQDGDLFFLLPQRLKDIDGIKRFEYDVTMPNWTDSVTINFTYESDSMVVPEDLAIICGETPIICSSYAPMFVDIKKNHYEIRVTSKFSLEDFKTMISSDKSPHFIFKQNGQLKQASYPDKAWIKEKKKLKDIINVYLYTK